MRRLSLAVGLLLCMLCQLACRKPEAGGMRRAFDPDASFQDAPGFATTCEQLLCVAPARCELEGQRASCICPSGLARDPDDPNACVDIDECASGSHDCDPNARCENRPGTFACICSEGFAGNGKLCRSRTDCEGAANTCHANAMCSRASDGVLCTCSDGFSGEGHVCTDLDECTAGTARCPEHAQCVNQRGSYDCACDPRYVSDGEGSERQCRDACDIAQRDASQCDPRNLARCSFTRDGRAQCTSCLPRATGNGRTCTPSTECEALGCGANTICSGAPGARNCACAPGFTGDPTAGCSDVDECAEASAGCDATSSTCLNTPGGYICSCLSGYERIGDACVDIDECARGSSLCDPSASCTDRDGGYTCACNPGFSGDGFTCSDVDECATGLADCSNDPSVNCQNTQGAYECVCPGGYAGNGRTEACYCDLSGYWGVRQNATLELPEQRVGNVVLIEGSITRATIWELHRYVYEGDTLRVEKRQCGADRAAEVYSPLYTETYSSATPNAVFDTMDFQRTRDVPLARSAALPGKPFVTPRDALVQGIRLDDPVNDPWPRSYRDVPESLWTDSDRDGEPGITLWPYPTTEATRDGTGTYSYLPVQLQGDSTRIETRAACVSTAVRAIQHLEGTIHACTRMSGRLINDRAEGRVHSCTVLRMADWDVRDVTCRRADWGESRKCTPEQIQFLDEQNQSTRASAEFESVKLGELSATDIDCAAVRMALPAL